MSSWSPSVCHASRPPIVAEVPGIGDQTRMFRYPFGVGVHPTVSICGYELKHSVDFPEAFNRFC
jgi:hypothetical protein